MDLFLLLITDCCVLFVNKGIQHTEIFNESDENDEKCQIVEHTVNHSASLVHSKLKGRAKMFHKAITYFAILTSIHYPG